MRLCVHICNQRLQRNDKFLYSKEALRRSYYMLITSWYYDERSREFKKTSLKELKRLEYDNKEEFLYIKERLYRSQNKSVPMILVRKVLKLTYRFFPYIDDAGNIEYQYNIFKGNDETKKFGSYERKYLNLKVIKALRDVESEIRNSRTSPIQRMLKDYAIDKKDLERIAEEYRKNGEEILNLDELVDLTNNINKRFGTILGSDDFDVSLQAMEISPGRVLSSLKLLMAQRHTSDISLGLNNILYISMILQMLQDKTVRYLLS